MKRIGLLIAIILVGCANPGIVRISPDTYMLSREDHGGIFGNASALKQGVIRDADAFAESQGKVAIPVTAHFKPVGYGPAQWASFEYQFRVVDKNDPEVSRLRALYPRPDLVVENIEKVSANVRTEEKSDKQKDIYNELIKLDDLRKKGIITQAEFETQKAKLLSGN